MSSDTIPVLKVGRTLLVTVRDDLDDRRVQALEADIAAAIVETGARGLLLDLTGVAVVDSFVGRVLGDIAAVARVLDARTVVVGLQPAVAITLVELGLTLPGIETARDVERGLELLRVA